MVSSRGKDSFQENQKHSGDEQLNKLDKDVNEIYLK